jgi:hypothetical protein
MINQLFYTGCDSKYWKTYGISFVNSFNFFNPMSKIHIHLINPDESDLQTISKLPCSYSTENLSDNYIDDQIESASNFLNNNKDINYSSDIKSGLKFCTKHEKEKDNLRDLITFSVFAIKRFVNLPKIINSFDYIAAYDIDTICKSKIDISAMLNGKNQGCLNVKGDRFVVSLVAFNKQSEMLMHWASILEHRLNEKKIYGFLDQDSFVNLSNSYDVEKISRIYCDHTNKSRNSFVMTGKGQTKYSDLFKNEQSKWLNYGNS